MGKYTGKTMQLLIVILVLSLSTTLFGQQRKSWTMEFRIAANVAEDSNLVEIGKNSDKQKIYKDAKLIGKWVEVLDSVVPVLEKDPNLVTRRNDKGRLGLLVVINENDVTEDDVRRIYLGKDRNGRLALDVRFDDKGSSKIFNLTKGLFAFGKPERYIAEIMDGKVYATHVIRSAVSRGAIITGDITQALIEDIKQRSQRDLVVLDVFDESEIPPYAITVTPLRLIIFFSILIIIVVGSLPAKQIQKSKRPHLWTISGIVIGMLIGAYKLGVTQTYGTSGTCVQSWEAMVGDVIQINLLWIFIGGAVGSGFGFLLGRLCRFFLRRAVHNIVVLLSGGGRCS